MIEGYFLPFRYHFLEKLGAFFRISEVPLVLSEMKVELLQVVLDLLQIPFDQKEDVRMNELMRLAHQFLQNFCLSNQNNQVFF